MPLFNDDASLIYPPHPGFISGKYYASTIYASNSNLTYSIGYVYYTYFFVPFQQSFSKIAFYCLASSSTQTSRLAIYNVVAGLPSKLIFESENISTFTSGHKEALCSVSLSAGWYAIALIFNPSNMTILAPSIVLSNLLGASSPGSSVCGYRATLAYGAFPSNASLTNISEINAPLIWLKTA